MMLFKFGLTKIGIKRKHEFGIRSFPKFVQVDLLLITFVILSKQQNRSLSELMRKYAFSENDLDWHPQVRLARRHAITKGRAKGLDEFKEQNKWLLKEVNEAQQRYQTSEIENRELRLTIKGMKLVGFVEEDLHKDDGETPTVIVEASRG